MTSPLFTTKSAHFLAFKYCHEKVRHLLPICQIKNLPNSGPKCTTRKTHSPAEPLFGSEQPLKLPQIIHRRVLITDIPLLKHPYSIPNYPSTCPLLPNTVPSCMTKVSLSQAKNSLPHPVTHLCIGLWPGSQSCMPYEWLIRAIRAIITHIVLKVVDKGRSL